jgi:hypothetical protein
MPNDTNENLRKIYRDMIETSPPAPWRQVHLHIGGVTAVGFGADTEWLLVMTHSGLGVVNAATGAIVARKDDNEILTHDPYPIFASGIGPLEGQRVVLGGLWGGGLRTTSRDGWVLHRASPSWPAECVILCPPAHPEIEDQGFATMLVKDLDPPVRAFGFSDSGKTLVVANTMIYIWSRLE